MNKFSLKRLVKILQDEINKNGDVEIYKLIAVTNDSKYIEIDYYSHKESGVKNE